AVEALNGLREPLQVFQGMELALVGETQGGSTVQALQRGTGDDGDLGQAGPMHRGQFLVELVYGIARGAEQVAVDTPEIAVNALSVDNVLYRADGRGMAVRGQ